MEALADAMKELPNMIGRRLQNLKNMDKLSREMLTRLSAEENIFLEQMKLLSKDSLDSQHADTSQSLFKRRHDLLTVLDSQMKNVQGGYDQIDKKIKYIGTESNLIFASLVLAHCFYLFIDDCTKNINYLFPLSAEEVMKY